ncbi:TIGR03943 family protein [Bacillus luteolus]|uniref:TIGR03943 family protein n=1 Tax=Litchfieldia luteola TaxID=682179 RepID=A0ABR9QH56_9BACI|nr:TIGR03943 family protein [Cytobacillus luteolus]MBE4907574.1 TIGR03943 family protein [Cytobacillus luteolus]MBP1944348.1 putative membrane protein [Cytobacillus luteolus]
MQFHFQQALRALILVAFSAMIVKLHLTGDITKYINPKYDFLSQSAAVLFFILFLIQLARVWTVKEEDDHHSCSHEDHHCSHDHGTSSFSMKKFISYCILVTPILTGFVFPAKVLDASIASKKGAMVLLSSQQQSVQNDRDEAESADSDEVFEGEDSLYDHEAAEPITMGETISNKEYEKIIEELRNSTDIIMDDYVYSTYYEEISSDLNHYKGKKMKLNGFVYKEEGFAEKQLVLARFLITHCVADASIVGFLSEMPEASSIDVDTWIEAEGVLEVTTYNGVEMPVLKITHWEKISEPEEPYLYPINVKLL